jgi:hypothetical protein
MDRIPIRITAPARLLAATYFESAPCWHVTDGPADWELVLMQSRCLPELELRHVPSGARVHRIAVPADERDQNPLWMGMLRRFALTRPVTATVLILRTRDAIQINRGFYDFVEVGMDFSIVRRDQQVASARVTSVQPGDSLLVVTDRGRGFKPEDTALSLWVP